MSTLTATALRPDAAEIGLAVINRVLPTYAAGMHRADAATLRHEAERLEAAEPSPVVKSMRAIVDGERQWLRYHTRAEERPAIRRWAASQGIWVAPAGLLPHRVVAAYRRAVADA